MAATPDLIRGPVPLTISICTGFLALTTCLMRFFARKRIFRNVGLDDYVMVVAAGVGFIGTIFSIIEGSSMADSAHALEFDWLGQPWFIMATAFVEISICLSFFRLVGDKKQQRFLLYSQILFMAVLNFAFSLATSLRCRPLAKLWDPSLQGDCWNHTVQLNIGYFQGALSVFWWLFLSLFPVVIVRDHNIRPRMKWPLYILSSLSLIAGIFVVIRTYEISRTVPGVYTFDTFFAIVLSILEHNIGMVAANILLMGPLFSKQQRDAIRAENRSDGASERGRDRRSCHPFQSGASSVRSWQSGSYGSSHDGSKIDERGTTQPRPSRSSTKRSSMLIIEGPRKDSFDSSSASSGSSADSPMATKEFGHSGTDMHSLTDPATPVRSSWPRGIIKTVEVEVVEEDIADVEPGLRPSPSTVSRLLVPGSGNTPPGRSLVVEQPEQSRQRLSDAVAVWTDAV